MLPWERFRFHSWLGLRSSVCVWDGRIRTRHASGGAPPPSQWSPGADGWLRTVMWMGSHGDSVRGVTYFFPRLFMVFTSTASRGREFSNLEVSLLETCSLLVRWLEMLQHSLKKKRRKVSYFCLSVLGLHMLFKGTGVYCIPDGRDVMVLLLSACLEHSQWFPNLCYGFGCQLAWIKQLPMLGMFWQWQL